MKVLIVAGIFPPDIGGPANYIPKFAESLIQRGHQVTVLTFSDLPVYAGDQTFSFPIYRILRSQNILMREIQTLLKGLQLALQCDVIYSNGNDFKALLIGTLTGRKRVHKIVGDTAWERAQNRLWTRHDLDSYQVEPKSGKLRFLDWVRSFPLRHASQIITPSFYLKKIVSGWGISNEKIKVIYNSFQPLPDGPLDLHKDFFAKNKHLKIMTTVCRLVPWKGVDTLIRCLHEVPDLGLVVIGDGPMEGTLKELAVSLKVENRILFAGRQPRDRIKSFLQRSDFFILNSSYEGLPHVVLEAMSVQKLVLASQVGGTPEVVRHQKTGLLFEYNNQQDIKAKIADAISVDHSSILNQASHFIATDFSFEKMISETEKALQSAISE